MKIEDQGLRIKEVLRMRIEDGLKITHFCRDFFWSKITHARTQVISVQFSLYSLVSNISKFSSTDVKNMFSVLTALQNGKYAVPEY